MNKFFLIGMPAAGKTTAGKFISSNTNLELFDLDEEIEKYCGKSEIYFVKTVKNISEKLKIYN